jgi:hypothetical protein
MSEMKFVGSIACLLVALDCADKALGVTADPIFTEEYLFVWWIVAAGWQVTSIGLLIEACRS